MEFTPTPTGAQFFLGRALSPTTFFEMLPFRSYYATFEKKFAKVWDIPTLQVALQEDEMSQVPSRRAATLFCIDTSCGPSSACDMRHAYKVCSSPMRCAGVVLTMASMSALPLQKKTPSPRRLRLR